MRTKTGQICTSPYPYHTQSMLGFPVKTGTGSGNIHEREFTYHPYLGTSYYNNYFVKSINCTIFDINFIYYTTEIIITSFRFSIYYFVILITTFTTIIIFMIFHYIIFYYLMYKIKKYNPSIRTGQSPSFIRKDNRHSFSLIQISLYDLVHKPTSFRASS